jgi:hypothetical protein
MPVAPNRKNPATQATAIAVAGLIGSIALIFVITRIASQASEGDLQLNLGDDVFTIGDAEDLAAKIDNPNVFGGDPLLLSGLGNDRDVWVQHLGDDSSSGWFVFAVRPDDAPRSCIALWERDLARFVDSCDGTMYPEDGEGLRQYPVEVIDGLVTATIAG